MRFFPRSALLIFLIVAACSMSTKKPTRVVFFGDSITQAGAKPGGFISLIGDALTQKGLASSYELIGAGISGNKVYDLYLRIEDDVLAKNPDVVFIWIGVNDVWHKVTSGTGTDADKFERFYTSIINKLLDKHIRTILVTPAVIGEKADFTNSQDGDMNSYSQIIRGLAQKYHCGLVDLRELFHNYELKNNPANADRGIRSEERRVGKESRSSW